MNPVGKWLKVVRGRRFIVCLLDDHKLTEAEQSAPEDVWHGTWSYGRSFEKALDDLQPSIGLHIGRWLTMLAFRGPDSLEGIERNFETNPRIVVPADYEQNWVELRRLQ